MKLLTTTTLFTALLLGSVTIAEAASTPKPSRTDARVRSVLYKEHDVVTIRGHLGYNTNIIFDESETVTHINAGDAHGWQITNPPSMPHMIIIKPSEVGMIDTNLSVFTDKRHYQFALSSTEKNVSSHYHGLTFTVKYRYPEEDIIKIREGAAGFAETWHADGKSSKQSISSRAISPADMNLDYHYSGDALLRPVHAFDDGTFTYFSFAEDAPTPAFFLVDQEGKERLVNYTRDKRYLVIEGTGAQFSLRHGELVACVFNRGYPIRAGEIDTALNQPAPLAEQQEHAETSPAAENQSWPSDRARHRHR